MTSKTLSAAGCGAARWGQRGPTLSALAVDVARVGRGFSLRKRACPAESTTLEFPQSPPETFDAQEQVGDDH
jgi:hypothetical protein